MVGGRELALVRMICLKRGQLTRNGSVEQMIWIWLDNSLDSCQILLVGAATC
jgi:hypothetical protein